MAATTVLIALMAMSLASSRTTQPRDPGYRTGPDGAGGPYAVLDNTDGKLDAADKAFFAAAEVRFREINTIRGKLRGLGPTYTGDSCGMCHVGPADGGSSASVNIEAQQDFVHRGGASNRADLSGIVSLNGPVRVVRFISKPDGTPDGTVHELFTIAGRRDAPGCTLRQPDFQNELARHNLAFRIPTPTFGLGLVESAPDSILQANLNSTAAERSRLGIGGRFNHDDEPGIARFGWKAQRRSLLTFAGEAYNVEQGVTNKLFPNKRLPDGTRPTVVRNSLFDRSVDDGTDISDPFIRGHRRTSDQCSGIVNFTAFMRMLAPSAPTTHTASEIRGRRLFSRIGCNLCHSPTLTAGKSEFPALSDMKYHPYSDFALHHMGPGLADGIRQGAAGPDEFRTAPLWGIGQRIFFIHDGRTSDLLEAIEDHASSPTMFDHSYQPSEANAVIAQFNSLTRRQRQDVLNFLRSL
jgi:CxxC motif-containing protein (DUF1111 family)